MITPSAQQILIRLAQMWAPEETVGYLVRGEDDRFSRVHCIPNMSKLPERNFQIRMNDLVDAQIRYGFEDVIVWHSHPASRPNPSRDDVFMMRQAKLNLMAIVGLHPFPIICVFRMENGRAVQIEKYRQEVMA